MRKPPRSRFLLIGFVIFALLVCLWIIWHGSQDRSSHTPNLTPQTTRDSGAPDSGPVRNRGAERAQVRLAASRSKYPEESPPNQRRLPPSAGTEKRRAVQSTISGIVANSQDGTPIQGARLTASPAGSEDVRHEAVSGSGGSFQMTIRGAGRYTLRAKADGFRPYNTDRLLVTPAERSLQEKILMTP